MGPELEAEVIIAPNYAIRLLEADVDHLTPAVHAVERIDPVWTEGGAIRRVLGKLWRLEAITV